jgi:hydrogenase maturation protein HypF
MFLLEKSVTMLQEKGYTVWVHRVVPANDGGISLGQVAVAGMRELMGLLE